jgi:hypothetical protein
MAGGPDGKDDVRSRRDGGPAAPSAQLQRGSAAGKRTLTAQLARRGAAAPTRGDVAQAAVDGKGAGAPVPDTVRATAESHLGADLGGARVHTDELSRASADAMGARAFAYGADVFLGTGESAGDVGLMAHELTHVVQQGAASAAPMAKLEVGAADSPAEREADDVAAAAVAGARPRGVIVEDGAPPGPGQMTRSALLAAMRGAVEAELAALPPERGAEARNAAMAQLAGAETRSAAELERQLASQLGPAATAEAYVAAARERARTAASPTAMLGDGVAATGAVVDAARAALGATLGGVTVHTGPEAAQLAAREGALAVTVGRHVAFAAGAYQPGTVEGDALFAHELAHVAQQDHPEHDGVDDARATGAAVMRSPAERTGEALAETDADAGAAAILARVHGGDRDATAAPRARGGLELRRCNRGNAPTQQQQQQLLNELDQAIADGEWEVIRARVYPQQAAAARNRHVERRNGTIPDLAGLGAIASIDRMVAAVRQLQANWNNLTVPERGAAIFDAANHELQAAGVPQYLDTAVEAMTPRGSFSRGEWKYRQREASLTTGVPTDAEAAELANTAQHESRHAEQHFLRARYLAGQGRNANQIVADTGIPQVIAQAAVLAPLGAMDARAGEAQTMDQAFGADGAAHGATSQAVSTAIAELGVRRTAAQQARIALAGNLTAGTVNDARDARDRLTQQIQTVENNYLAYRAIPYEADAHEVGDSTTEAFLNP